MLPREAPTTCQSSPAPTVPSEGLELAVQPVSRATQQARQSYRLNAPSSIRT